MQAVELAHRKSVVIREGIAVIGMVNEIKHAPRMGALRTKRRLSGSFGDCRLLISVDCVLRVVNVVGGFDETVKATAIKTTPFKF